MKKSLIYIACLLLGLLLGLALFFAYKYYQERVGNPTEVELAEKENYIDTLEEFVSLIKFKNGEGVTLAEADGFAYTSDGEDGVQTFFASTFYAYNKDDQASMWSLIDYFKTAWRVKNFRLMKESELGKPHQMHNKLHTIDADGENSYKTIKDDLEKKLRRAQITEEEMVQLSYIYTLAGDYEESHALDKKNCRKNKSRCKLDVDILIKGSVKDQDGKPLEGVEVYLLNYPEQAPARTDVDGIFSATVKTKALEKIRVRAKKQGYTAVYGDFYVVTPGPAQERELNLVMNESHGTVVVNTDSGSIEIGSAGAEVKNAKFEGGSFVIETSISTYKIPQKAIVTLSGRPYRGSVNVYVYEFDKSSNVDNLLRVDAQSRDNEKLFLGSELVTFGMPYLQFFATDTSEELFIDRSNPATISSKIAEMSALLDSKASRGMTLKSMEKLVVDSKRLGGFPISREYLLENDMLSFPMWWMLDQKRGMWDTVPVRVLDVDGHIETIYYSIYLNRK